jgi:WD40 repeat protein
VDDDDVDGSDRRSTVSEKSKASSVTVESAATDDSQSLDPPDVKIKEHDCHTDSVYSVAWSPADAWVYCSLSLDGRVYLHHVPAAEKYKLLL